MRPPHTLIVPLVVVLVVVSGVVAADGGTVIDHRGDEILLDAVADQRVQGTTPYESGTVIGVRIKSVEDTHPFLVSKAVRVGTNGSFSVTFDLSELAPLHGGPVHVEVRHNETTVHEIDGILVTKNMPDDSTLTYHQPTDESTATDPSPTTTTTTDTGSLSGIQVPGLGLAAGVIALVAVALLARR
ncbi:hypothetical protein GJR96_15010 [Haloferax sp. MBLA0076]|uniref:PGF-CTERM sorting domain-containing protein n=1 Tax=Haloferax litoreum TaxID=2666140 RepID=A0A6A8GKF1_9EURY|nr:MULTISPECIES: BGTF surface domain-containing protein [Haloferax]KAB1194681.1 hypothetical protein Hfx1148_14940 [Haloferax sp. CBA1148]MRX23261.1 hypothetical protein [Haloferax litoreum]